MNLKQTCTVYDNYEKKKPFGIVLVRIWLLMLFAIVKTLITSVQLFIVFFSISYKLYCMKTQERKVMFSPVSLCLKALK